MIFKIEFLRSNNYFLILFLDNFFWLNSFFVNGQSTWLYRLLHGFFSFRINYLSGDTRIFDDFDRLGCFLCRQIHLFLIWHTSTTRWKCFKVYFMNFRRRLLVLLCLVHRLHYWWLIIVVTIDLLIWIFINILIFIKVFRNMIRILRLRLRVNFWFFFNDWGLNRLLNDGLLRNNCSHWLFRLILFGNSNVCKGVIIWCFRRFLKLEIFGISFVSFIVVPVKSVLIIDLIISSIVSKIHQHFLSFVEEFLFFLFGFFGRLFWKSNSCWFKRLLLLSTKLRLLIFWWLFVLSGLQSNNWRSFLNTLVIL